MNDDKEEEEEYLSDHTRFMRLAAVYCQEKYTNSILPYLQQGLDDHPHFISTTTTTTAQQQQEELETLRLQSYQHFWNAGEEEDQQSNNSSSSSSSSSSSNSIQVPEIHISEMTPQEFRKQFHNANLPCLIHGLETTCFAYLNQQWNEKNSKEWFLSHVGPQTQVPLRYVTAAAPQQHDDNDNDNNNNIPKSSMDSEGRAEECQTRHVTMQEWIDQLFLTTRNDNNNNNNGSNNNGSNNNNNSNNAIYYLKDWHLQLQLEHSSNNNNNDNKPSFCHDCLYQVPEIFQYDLLNSFLLQFTNGDYRFCYWGPVQSFTARHFDVLHSFSWSYNVVGTKQWTFFCNNNDDNHSKQQQQQFRLIQHAGQAVFVPSMWQHSVMNLEETISINHNWITTANIDWTWKCLQIEMQAIQTELAAWGLDDDNTNNINAEACESMLRGCVGLDVTAFLFMVLVRLVDLISTSLEDDDADNDDPERSLDILRLVTAIDTVLSDDESVRVQQRLEAVLLDVSMAKQSLAIMERLVHLVKDSS